MSVAEICVDDVEELSYSVDPWQIQMQQLAGGSFSGDTPIAELAGVKLTVQLWIVRMYTRGSRTGLTPNMTLIQTIQQSRSSRICALLALLFVLGLQSLEASHSHAHHDGAVECLACKNSSADAIAVIPPCSIEADSADAPLAEHTERLHTAVIRPYDSRGPPHFS